MGKWDHRPSRRFFRQRRSPVRPSKFYDINAPLPEFCQDGIPLWEKKYCTLIGSVPWQKIVDSKRDVYCHGNVFNWKDSAAEEAFQNAKKCYWAKINSLPCDISLPDPDTYNDQIDWNPYIDPELINEIDSAYFALPDEEHENAIKNKRTKVSVNSENTWETGTPLSRALENEEQGWNQGSHHVDDSGNMDNTNNPWESSTTRGNEGLTDNAWKSSSVNSWGLNAGMDHKTEGKDWNRGYLPKDKGWGKFRDSSWCQKQSNNFANARNSSWECKLSRQNLTPSPRNTGWGNSGADVSGWKQQENADVSSDLQFRRNNGGWTGRHYWRGDGSNQHTLGYNGSQFQIGHHWRGEKGRKRGFIS